MGNNVEFIRMTNDNFDTYEDLSKQEDWYKRRGSVPIFVPEDENEIVKDTYNVLFKSSKINMDEHLGPYNLDGNKVIQKFEMDEEFKGFTVHLNASSLERLVKDPMVQSIEAESEFGIGHNNKCWRKKVKTPSWALERISHRELGGFGFLKAKNAGRKVHIYIIDTGVKADHSSFGKRVLTGKNFIKGEDETDYLGHGTCVAGCAAGDKYGIARDAFIVPVKAVKKNGKGRYSDLISALIWSAKQINTKKLKGIINISGYGLKNILINLIVDKINHYGIPVIVAAGNENTNARKFSPASAKGALAVGSTDINDEVSIGTNFGPNVLIHAPGTSVVCPGIKNKNDQRSVTGTSFSASYTSGVAAVFLANGIQSDKIYDAIIRISSKDKISGIKYNTPNRLLHSGCDVRNWLKSI